MAVQDLVERPPEYHSQICQWDVSNITDFFKIFYDDERHFNEDIISAWDVSNATDTTSMFDGCHRFNVDISGWDVSKVTIMESMFEDCHRFNVDISGIVMLSTTTLIVGMCQM